MGEKKHEVYYKKANNCQEFIEALNGWKADNREYLYIVAHGNETGICIMKGGNEFITWQCLSKYLSNTTLTTFASCNSQNGSKYCSKKFPAQSFMGTTSEIEQKHGTKWVIEFLDSLWCDGKYNFDDHFGHLTSLNSWIKLEFSIDDLFVMHPEKKV